MAAIGEVGTADVDRLLAEVAKIIGNERYGWLATVPPSGGIRMRPMGKVAFWSDDEWSIHFIADGRSTKVADLRQCKDVSIVYQRERDDAYVALVGAAILREHSSELRERWKEEYEPYFPTVQDKAHAVFIEVSVIRMDLWIRGLTSHPFGMRTTTLERGPTGWRRSS
jgi:general stress protein 26